MLKRFYSKNIASYLEPNKVLVIYGPRRVGKTMLIKDFLSTYTGKIYDSTGEDSKLRSIFESMEISKIKTFFSGYDIIFIDEAQKIPNAGDGLKILVDQIPNILVIATGSSSFKLQNRLGEPLVGRQNIKRLYPFSVEELVINFGNAHVFDNLENLMLFGSYPEVITSDSFEKKINYLYQIRDSYLCKDILELENIKNSRKLLDLLRLVAFQIGNEVSIEELGNNLDLSKNTVAKYLDLLEKAFVLINVRGFSRNLRKEVTKKSRYYFYDLGIRNAVIDNFNFIKTRTDVGQLWENFLFIERLKKRSYNMIHASMYFWRTWDQKEIDLIEERGGRLYGFEFKYGNKEPEAPKDWTRAYPDASYKVINQDNFLEFVT